MDGRQTYEQSHRRPKAFYKTIRMLFVESFFVTIAVWSTLFLPVPRNDIDNNNC